MKNYLDSLLLEQKNRARALKNQIHYPLKYSELSGLAERCTNILDGQMEYVDGLRGELQNRDENDLRDILRDARNVGRQVSLVEYYGIPALYYQTDEIGFMNKLIFKIHQESNIPLAPPSVCCTSADYYFSNLFTNVIFVPLTESDFFMHLPDLYHEIGHCVLQSRDSISKSKPIWNCFKNSFSMVTDYYNKLLKEKKREFGPEGIPITIERIHSQWKDWIEEFFCDLIALYSVGPAYAWSHLHLTIKQSDDIYRLFIGVKQTHPSDEARMRILKIGLNQLGFKKTMIDLQIRWTDATRYLGSPSSMYHYAFPDCLLEIMAKDVLIALKECGFSVMNEKLLKEKDSIRSLLNEAWERFWSSSPEEYRAWEEKRMAQLKISF